MSASINQSLVDAEVGNKHVINLNFVDFMLQPQLQCMTVIGNLSFFQLCLFQSAFVSK